MINQAEHWNKQLSEVSQTGPNACHPANFMTLAEQAYKARHCYVRFIQELLAKERQECDRHAVANRIRDALLRHMKKL